MQDKQDEVASRLMRPSVEEMRELIYEYGYTGWRANMMWGDIVKDPMIGEFLLSHGWTINDYVNECKPGSITFSRYAWIAQLFIDTWLIKT